MHLPDRKSYLLFLIQDVLCLQNIKSTISKSIVRTVLNKYKWVSCFSIWKLVNLLTGKKATQAKSHGHFPWTMVVPARSPMHGWLPSVNWHHGQPAWSTMSISDQGQTLPLTKVRHCPWWTWSATIYCPSVTMVSRVQLWSNIVSNRRQTRLTISSKWRNEGGSGLPFPPYWLKQFLRFLYDLLLHAF